MTDSTCSIEGCEKSPKVRGWCTPHYQKQYRDGPITARPVTADCAKCGKTFTASHGRIYCNRTCREEAKYAELRNDPERWAAYLEKLRNGYTKKRDQPGYVNPLRTNPVACTEKSCEQRAKARGLCGTHYNAAHATNRHPKVELNCDGCGKAVLKESRTARRYATVQCDDWLCRRWLTFGTAKSTPLPKDHWALMIGSTCEWPKPSMLKTHEPVPKMDFTCEWCGEAFQSHQSTAKYCGDKCAKRRSRKVRRAREFNAPGYFTWTEVTRLWLAFDKTCAYCSIHLDLGDVQAEHVQPLSKQGRNDIGNILPSCSACNSDKSAMLLPEWAASRAKRGLPPVKITWTWDDHRYRHIVPHVTAQAA